MICFNSALRLFLTSGVEFISMKRFQIILGIIAIILLIPLIAMQFSTEVSWSAFDFLVAAVLLLSTGTAIEVILRLVKSRKMRWILCLSVLFILFIIWAELAVGVFGTAFAGS